MKLLQERDDKLCEANPNRRSSHYFVSFFMNKLMDCDVVENNPDEKIVGKKKVYDLVDEAKNSPVKKKSKKNKDTVRTGYNYKNVQR